MRFFNFQNWCSPYKQVFLSFSDIFGNYVVAGVKKDQDIDTKITIDHFFKSRDPKLSYPYGKGIHFLNYSVSGRTPRYIEFTLNKADVPYQGQTKQVFDYPNALFVSTRTEKQDSVSCVHIIRVNRRGGTEFFRFGSVESPSYPLIVSSYTDDTVEGKNPYNWGLSIKGVPYNKMPSNLIDYFLNPSESLAAERINTDSIGGITRYPVVAFFPQFSDDSVSLNLITGNRSWEPDYDLRNSDLCSGVQNTRAFSDELAFDTTKIENQKYLQIAI